MSRHANLTESSEKASLCDWSATCLRSLSCLSPNRASSSSGQVVTPFDSIEGAHEYVALLVRQVEIVKSSLAEDVTEAARETAGRRLDAMRLVDYKLTQLEDHLVTSARLLNDLRALRRLLLGERESRES